MKSHNFLLKIVSVIIISTILTGCSGTATPLSATATSIPPSETPSITLVEPTPTPLPVSTSVPATSLTIADKCIPVEENLPNDLALSGVWLRNEATPYFENLDDHADYLVPFKGGGLFREYAISPDGKLMAYIDPYMDPARNGTEKRILRVVRSSGHAINMDYWVEDWQSILVWVDNQNIALLNAKEEIIILNPLTGEWKNIQEPRWLPQKASKYDYFPNYTFGPTLNLIFIRPDYKSHEVRDFQTGKVIWQAKNSADVTWSPDGSMLIITPSKGGFIYLITKDMQVKKYDIRNITPDPVYQISLSPNGSMIALDDSTFFLFDLTQTQVNKLCAENIQPWYDPIWSPDNRFIIQPAHISFTEEFDLLIDTQEMHAYKLISGQYNHRIAWLAKP